MTQYFSGAAYLELIMPSPQCVLSSLRNRYVQNLIFLGKPFSNPSCVQFTTSPRLQLRENEMHCVDAPQVFLDFVH